MENTVHVLGIDVDLLSQEDFESHIINFLEEDGLSVVHMISLDYIGTYETNELVDEVLEQADLILPGEKAVLSAHHVDVLEAGGMMVDYKCFMEFSQFFFSIEKKGNKGY